MRTREIVLGHDATGSSSESRVRAVISVIKNRTAIYSVRSTLHYIVPVNATADYSYIIVGLSIMVRSRIEGHVMLVVAA